MSFTEDSDNDSFQSINNEIQEADDYETDDENDEGSGWITLNGCGKITRWQYPENETRCTEIDCSLECGSRLAAIEHYKEQHAAYMILCYLCDSPIHAKIPDDFEKHYVENHPTIDMPFIFNSANKLSEGHRPDETQATENDDKEEEQSGDSDEEDDLIRLSGCGKITCWLFPKHQKICPIETCNKNFANRSDAIRHYREEHSNNSIFCYLCENPILAFRPDDFKLHYKTAHPNTEMAFCFDEKLQTTEKQSSRDKETQVKKHSNGNKCELSDGSDVNTNQSDVEMITLSGCGFVTQWQISHTDWTCCPITNCQKQFKLRSHAILHFKKCHAANSICCPTCKRPILAQNFSDFAKHHEGHGESDVILLSGCGQISQWGFPNDYQHCPVRNCFKKFTSRANAIAHYKSKHVQKSIFCNLCDRPYVMRHPHHFIQHFRNNHPDATCPYNFNTREYQVNYNSEETNAMSGSKDVIQLKGCGQTTYWSFPKMKWAKCRISGCRGRFQRRSEAITHYKKYHTENFVLCVICDKPIRTNYPIYFKAHYRNVHPNEKIPYEFKRANKNQNRNESDHVEAETTNDVDDVDDVDDLITLNGCGYITQWQFPKDLTQCPLKRYCGEEFTTRKDLINHYKEKHSQKSILCSLCNKPICVSKSKMFKIHYERKHPNEPLPYDFEPNKDKTPTKSVTQDEQSNDVITLTGGRLTTYWRWPKSLTKCPKLNCGKEFKSQSQVVAHFKKLHASSSILCTFCDRPITVTTYLHDFVKHHDRMHPNMKLPYDFSVKKKKSETSSVKEESVEDDGVDDMIKLSGFGQITYWKFPEKITQCPFQVCRKSFQLRLTAIAHYRKCHAPSAILCSICNKPICVNVSGAFQRHYQRKHPGVPVPSKYTAQSLRSSETITKSELEHKNDGMIQKGHDADDDDDMIILRGLGMVTKWRFPNTTQCPVLKCQLYFDSRLEAIQHYRQRHANHNKMCTVCNKPINVSPGTSNWKKHCQGLEHQKNAIENKDATNADNQQMSGIMPCPLMDCSFKTTKMHKLRTHWDIQHSSLRFPEMRQDNSFGYSSSLIKQKIAPLVKRNQNQMDSDSDDSLLKPISTESSSSDEIRRKNKSIYKIRRKKLKKRNKYQRATKHSNSSTDSEEMNTFAYNRKRKMIDEMDGMPKQKWRIKTEVLSEAEELSANIDEPSFSNAQQDDFNGTVPVPYRPELTGLIPKIIDVKSININQDPQITSNVQVENRQSKPVQEPVLEKRRYSC